MKQIKNPVTGKEYKVKEHSSKYDPNKKIEGLWSNNMICTDYFKPSKADININFLYPEEINEDDYKDIEIGLEYKSNLWDKINKEILFFVME